MLIIGLTGGIGSGKTTVSNLFVKYGTPIIDTDLISREIVNNPAILQTLIETFGEVIIDSNGTLDRSKLSSIIFSQADKKHQLEKILHPKIRNEVTREIQAYSSRSEPPAYIIVVIPLLLETGFDQIIDRILTVIADEEIRLKRVIKRDSRDSNEIRSIINSQASDKERLTKSDDIIENNNNFNGLYSEVAKLHQQYSTLSSE